MSSPAFGGRSWLADATLLTGMRLRNQEQYESYLISGSRNPDHLMGELGYHHILAASGTQYSTPDWESRNEFDSYLLEKDFGYREPFEAQPEYVDDWDSLGDDSIFHDGHVRYFRNNWLWGGEFPEGYLFSIDYELRIIREFMDRYVDPESLVVILGDHQPRIPISEAEASVMGRSYQGAFGEQRPTWRTRW